MGNFSAARHWFEEQMLTLPEVEWIVNKTAMSFFFDREIIAIRPPNPR
jgi:hypothetical protein